MTTGAESSSYYCMTLVTDTVKVLLRPQQVLQGRLYIRPRITYTRHVPSSASERYENVFLVNFSSIKARQGKQSMPSIIDG